MDRHPTSQPLSASLFVKRWSVQKNRCWCNTESSWENSKIGCCHYWETVSFTLGKKAVQTTSWKLSACLTQRKWPVWHSLSILCLFFLSRALFSECIPIVPFFCRNQLAAKTVYIVIKPKVDYPNRMERISKLVLTYPYAIFMDAT